MSKEAERRARKNAYQREYRAKKKIEKLSNTAYLEKLSNKTYPESVKQIAELHKLNPIVSDSLLPELEPSPIAKKRATLPAREIAIVLLSKLTDHELDSLLCRLDDGSLDKIADSMLHPANRNRNPDSYV